MPAIAFLIDYDGTISTIDMSDELVRVASSEQELQALDQPYRQGTIGTRALLEAEVRLLPRDPAALRDVIENQRHDPTFGPFVHAVRALGATVEVVSDGLGFFVPPAIAAIGVGDLPIYAAAVEFGPDGPTIRFPAGNPACPVCGTCKRSRVLAHQEAGRHVIFVGDGFSDQFAVSYADTVFAKGDLTEICRDRGVDFQPWSTFNDILAWLRAELAQGSIGGPRSRPFVCGPEVVR